MYYHPKSWFAEDLEALRRLAGAGYFVDEITFFLNRSDSAIRGALRKHRIPVALKADYISLT